MAVVAWADIPAGKNIYLDVSNCPDWQGAPCYLIHLSRTSMTHVMQPVPGKPNLYVYTTTASTQDNINFGLGKVAVSADFSGWFGSYVSKNIERNGWSSVYPVFVIDCPAGGQTSGHWAALPADDTVTGVSYELESIRCVDSTYTLLLHVTLSGSAATLRISGDLLTSDRVITSCATPYTTSLRGKWSQAEVGVTHTLTFSACSDAAGTNVNNTITLDVVQPDLECEVTAEADTICKNEATVTLTATNTGDSIQWKNAQGQPVGTGTTLTIPAPKAGTTYTAYIYEPYVNPDDNLMVNGDFENGYSGFMSDYEPIRDKVTNQPVVNPTWIYSNKYKNGSSYGKYYCITNNAYDLQESGIFYPVKPHGGEEFLVVDATNQGYAWYTNTAQSPQLVLTAGQTYIFSYWVACPNTGAQLNDPKAQLQFIIELHMPDGSTKKAQLTNTYTVGMQNPVNDWYYQEVTWYCPYNCNDVTIGVKDLTQSAGGNDFCLDDIIFQPINPQSMRLAMTEHHPVVVEDCEVPVEPDTVSHQEEVCVDSTLTLTVPAVGTYTLWEDGTNGRSITVTPTAVGTTTYVARTYSNDPTAIQNIMPNGDFEAGFSDFDCDFQKCTDNTQVNQPPYRDAAYCAIVDTMDHVYIRPGVFDYGYANITAQSGRYFLFVDANAKGYAWKTDVQVTQGVSYDFSYYAAYPFRQAGRSAARLQFVVVENGVTTPLGTEKTIGGPSNAWVKDSVRWTASVTGTVTIGVKDNNTTHDGNDFCLDNIRFFPAQGADMLVRVDSFYVDAIDCSTPEPEPEPDPEPEPEDCQEVVYAKWNNVLFVNNGPTGLNGQAQTYAWYQDGVLIQGATEQSYYNPSGMSGTYWAKITLRNGSVVSSCPHTFADTDRSADKNPGTHPKLVSVQHYWVGNGLSVDCYVYEDGSVLPVKVLSL